MENQDELEVSVDVVATGKVARPFTFTTVDTVWRDLLQLGNEEAGADVVKAISKELAGVYSGTFESGDEVSITPTAKWAPQVAGLFTTLGFETDLSTIPAPEKGTRTTGEGRVKVEKEPTFCLFSGLPTSGGKFRPGYDMKMRGALTRIIDNTKIGDDDETIVGEGDAATPYTVAQAHAKLVEFGWYGSDELRERRRKAFGDVQKKADAAAAREAEKIRLKAEKEAAKAAAAATPVEIEAPEEDAA